MPSGIRINELAVGTGAKAARGALVYAHVRMTLHRGDVLLDTFANGKPILIDLARRECIAGLRKGIEGMCVGGRRRLRISPHLAYGAEGAPASGIPANAVVDCEVELVEVRESRAPRPEDFPPGRQLLVHHPGESAPGSPRWQFALYDDGRCGFNLTYPIPGASWRHAVDKHEWAPSVERAMAEALFAEALALPRSHPAACLADEMVGSQGGYTITRDRQGNPCLGIYIYDRWQSVCHYHMVTTDPAWLASRLWAFIENLLRPHLDVVFRSEGRGVSGRAIPPPDSSLAQ